MNTTEHASKLDTDYFSKKLSLIQRDIAQYTPQELATELRRLSETALPHASPEQDREKFEEFMETALAQFIVDVGESGFVLSEESQNCFKDGLRIGHEKALASRNEELEAEITRLSGTSGYCLQCEAKARENESLQAEVAMLRDALKDLWVNDTDDIHAALAASPSDWFEKQKKLIELKARADEYDHTWHDYWTPLMRNRKAFLDAELRAQLKEKSDARKISGRRTRSSHVYTLQTR